MVPIADLAIDDSDHDEEMEESAANGVLDLVRRIGRLEQENARVSQQLMTLHKQVAELQAAQEAVDRMTKVAKKTETEIGVARPAHLDRQTLMAPLQLLHFP